MKKNNLKILLIIFISFIFFPVFGQVSVNPQDDFYQYVQSWQSRGIITKVPPLRPYPIKDIREIINLVLEKGNDFDKEIAQIYLDKIEEKSWYFNETTTLFYRTNLQNKRPYGVVSDVKAEGDISFKDDLVSFGYSLGFNLRTIEKLEDIYPLYTNYDIDARFDPAKIGPLYTFLNINNCIAFSNNGFILQAGMNRVGYGDFINEGLSLNDSSYHIPNLSISYYNDKISYTQTIATIGATSNNKFYNYTDENGNDYQAVPVYPSKFLAFHAIEYKPIPKLSMSFYENVVFGKRFDFSYLIPTTYMVTQGISGYNDSIMMGTRLSFTPVKSLVVATDLLVDDLSVNELAKLNFDSKNRIGWTTGVKYLPGNFINSISLDYTMITPYTYAHWDVDDETSGAMSAKTVNYQNYTNSGYQMGSAYSPNSDVINFSATFNPVSKLKIDLNFAFMRHANICETLTDEEAMGYLMSDKNVFSTDGSVYTHQFGYLWQENLSSDNQKKTQYMGSAWDYLNFLNQDSKMYVTKAKFACGYEIYSRKTFSISLNAAYSFEYIINKGVDQQMYQGGSVEYDEKTESFIYSGNKETKNYHEVVDYYKNQWRSGFTNEINHYLYLGCTVRF